MLNESLYIMFWAVTIASIESVMHKMEETIGNF